jgi:hypothetical protein
LNNKNKGSSPYSFSSTWTNKQKVNTWLILIFL